MSDGPRGKYFSEAHRFEAQTGFLLNYLKPPNTLPSTHTFASGILRCSFDALYHHYRQSLEQRRPKVSKEKWLLVGRATLAKLKTDLKLRKEQISKAMKKNVWQP